MSEPKVNLIQLPGAPARGYRYVCQKCGEVLTQYEVEIDGEGGLIHQSDAEAVGDPLQWKGVWCGPVHQELIPHSVEDCEDPRCEDPDCVADRKMREGDRLYDERRDREMEDSK